MSDPSPLLAVRIAPAALLGLALMLAAGVRAQGATGAVTGSDLAHACRDRDGWADPAPPSRIFGNSWYVGTCGISVLLITSREGHVLIDGGPAAAAALVAANIERLGFRPTDVRWIVSSHEHDDHVGALAELKRLTGARVAAIRAAAASLSTGKPAANDPQRAVVHDFAPIAIDRILSDGDRLRLGPIDLTVRSTPAHSPGSASWTWTSCETRCRKIAYADSATAISGDAYRFTDHPDRVAGARAGLSRIGRLPCDILVTPHPGASELFARMGGRAPLGDRNACRHYAEAAGARFAARLAEERDPAGR